MKLLAVERRGNDVTIRIHANTSAWVLDPERPQLIAVQSEGIGTFRIVPDPQAVRVFTHGLRFGDDAPSVDDQVRSALQEAVLLVQDELDRAAAPQDLTANHQLPSAADPSSRSSSNPL